MIRNYLFYILKKGKVKTLLCCLLLLFSMQFLSGCAALFVAAGAGAGAYTYISGNLVREYQADFESSVKASLQTMRSLEFKLIEEKGDGLWVTIEGKRADETPVYIELERLGPSRTEVGVRTGEVGYFNLQVSEQIHEYLAKNLSNMPKYRNVNLVEPAEPQTLKKADTGKAKTTAPETRGKAESIPSTKSSITIRDTVVAKDLNYLNNERNTIYVYFQKGEKGVTSRMHAPLNKAVAYLKKDQSIKVAIYSYTDSVGSNQANLAVSKMRAESVRQYLVIKGVGADRITARGLGASNFFESNATERLRAMNRRVELHFSK